MAKGHKSGRRSEEHTSELQSRGHLVCRLLLEKKTRHKGRYQPAAFDGCAALITSAIAAHRAWEDALQRAEKTRRKFSAPIFGLFFFFNDAAPPEISPLSPHDALPI